VNQEGKMGRKLQTGLHLCVGGGRPEVWRFKNVKDTDKGGVILSR
jgi:hypothetical protein